MFYEAGKGTSIIINPTNHAAGPERLSEAALSQETAGCPQDLGRL
jgi:hypothetical protein